MRHDLLSEIQRKNIEENFSSRRNEEFRNTALYMVKKIFPNCQYVDTRYVIQEQDGEECYCLLNWGYPEEFKPQVLGCRTAEELLNLMVWGTLWSCLQEVPGFNENLSENEQYELADIFLDMSKQEIVDEAEVERLFAECGVENEDPETQMDKMTDEIYRLMCLNPGMSDFTDEYDEDYED